MKLFLSSYFLGNHPDELAKLVDSNKKVGIIMNAADIYSNAKRPDYLEKEVTKMSAIGLEAEELDLRDYFEDNAELNDRLKHYGLLWVMGGNSFVLRRAMRLSGFDTLIGDLVNENNLVYGGFSAGAVVATKTLRGIDLVDDPNSVPEGYPQNVIWEGLGFVDFSIAPHYRSDHPESESIEKVVEYFQTNSMPYKALSDGEALVVRDENVLLLN